MLRGKFLMFAMVVLSQMTIQASGRLGRGRKSGRRYRQNFDTDVVHTTSGPVIGKTTKLPTGKLVDQYLGIKYAQAERLEKPHPPQSWVHPFHAHSFGKSCPQKQYEIDGNLVPVIDEDCLFINVFVPNRKQPRNQLFHVMHWIHGGAYFANSGNQVGAEMLASESDVIVVTSNYRLGALGYLATGETNLPGNYGMFDQLEALKWVQENIASFGGDPTSVTLFGESAGAFSVSLHILSPLADQLFHRAIAESGAAIGLPPFLPTELAKKTAGKFAEKIGCPLETLKTCLQGKTTAEIMTAQGQSTTLSDLSYLPWAPITDGDFLQDTPDNLLKEGKFIQRNVMMGINNDEGGLLVANIPEAVLGSHLTFKFLAKFVTWIKDQTRENEDSIIFQYTNWTDPEDPASNMRAVVDLITDPVFKAPTIKTVQAYVEHDVPTYLYQLEHGPDEDYMYGPMPDWIEAYHGADITYVFGIPLLQDGATYSDPEVKFSMDMMKLWSNFAKTGNPTPAGSSLQWPQYNSETQEYMALKPDAFEVKSKLRAEYMEFWNEYLPKQTCVVTSCKNQPDGKKFPYPGNCRKYYQCKDGIAEEKKCGLLYEFSVYTYECVVAMFSGCQSKRR